MGIKMAVPVVAAVAVTCLGTPAVLAARPAPAVVQPAKARSSSPARTSDARKLRERISKALKGSTAGRVHWRFDVVGIGTVAHEPSKLSHPASNEKLFTTETALQVLGPNFRYVTKLGTTGRIVGHTLHGSLVAVGGGDPRLDASGLAALARRVKKAGIRKVTSGLIVNDSRYQLGTSAPGWKKHFVPDDVGPVDAFAVDEDEWSDSASYTRHPAVANAGLLRRALRKAGVKVRGRSRRGAPKLTSVLARDRSQRLAEIVDYTLTQSDNFAAEMILRELGYAASGVGSRQAGLAAVRAEAATLATPIGVVKDGSGLSYDDKESPDLLVGWLYAIARSSTGTDVRDDLPVACETGTLSDRLCGPTTRGRVEAKTGHLNHDNVLSGYFATKSGRAVTFSIMLSKVRDQLTADGKIDAAVSAVARFDR